MSKPKEIKAVYKSGEVKIFPYNKNHEDTINSILSKKGITFSAFAHASTLVKLYVDDELIIDREKILKEVVE